MAFNGSLIRSPWFIMNDLGDGHLPSRWKATT